MSYEPYTDEDAQDAVAQSLTGLSNLSVSYDDANDEIKIDTSALNEEQVEDVVGQLLSGGNGISLNYDDQNDTLTVSIPTDGVGTDEIAASAVTPTEVDGSGGSDGQVLTSTGSSAQWESLTGSLEWSIISSNTTATSGKGFLIDASGGNVTLTLPSSPVEGDRVGVVDYTNSAKTNEIRVNGNGENIEGFSAELLVDVNGAGFTLVYSDSSRGWEVATEVGPGELKSPEGPSRKFSGGETLASNTDFVVGGSVAVYGDLNSSDLQLGYPLFDETGSGELTHFWPFDELNSNGNFEDYAGDSDAIPGGDGLGGTAPTANQPTALSRDGVSYDANDSDTTNHGLLSWINTVPKSFVVIINNFTDTSTGFICGVKTGGSSRQFQVRLNQLNEGDVWVKVQDADGDRRESATDPTANNTPAVNDGGLHLIVVSWVDHDTPPDMWVDGQDVSQIDESGGFTVDDDLGVGNDLLFGALNDQGSATGFTTLDIDEIRLYQSEVGSVAIDLWPLNFSETAQWNHKSFANVVNVNDLELQNGSVNVPSSATLTAVVHRTDSNGSIQETSDTLDLSSGFPISVTGLSTDGKHFAFEITEMSTSDPSISAVYGDVDLVEAGVTELSRLYPVSKLDLDIGDDGQSESNDLGKIVSKGEPANTILEEPIEDVARFNWNRISDVVTADDIDGDQLPIDWNPQNYAPDSSISEAEDLDDLSAHLVGLDDRDLKNMKSTATKTLVLSGSGLWPSTTSGATGPAQTEFTTNDIDLVEMEFPDVSSDTYAQVTGVMPDNWDGGVINARFLWRTTGTSGSVLWGLQGIAYSDDEAIDTSWGTRQTVLDAAGSASNNLMKSGTTPDITLAGSPSGGDMVQFRISRLGGNADDDLSASAYLNVVQIEYTESGYSH